jgi:CHAT domain-containing protein
MEAVETLKTAELQNYFSDPCVTSMQARQTRLDEAPPHCAVLYPISFSDSLGLLLIIEDEILQVWVPVSNRQLSETARNFRRHLQNRAVYRYWKDGNRLYDWLIRPIENQIKERGIETLIVAPDGALRLIPFSVLPEAKTYLIEKYAIVTVPAMSLTDSGPLDLAATGILVGALSQARRGFDALPNVTKEAEEIRRTAGGQVLEDEQFTLSNLSREIKETEYHVVHMATHGYFGSSGEDSFLLTYDDKLTMNALEELVGYGRFREKPLDLLYLSACQTAVGDERAALGLAGLAVKAGARNAVAGLWMVDDEAAYLTVREFYRNLKDAPGISKAKALQKAQQSLLENSRHHHPASWAPFLLIGNWH